MDGGGGEIRLADAAHFRRGIGKPSEQAAGAEPGVRAGAGEVEAGDEPPPLLLPPPEPPPAAAARANAAAAPAAIPAVGPV